MTESSKKYAQKSMEIAETFLKSAKATLKIGDLRTAVDRAYYAMFHAAQAVLVWMGISPSRTHRGLRNSFGKNVVLKGLCDKRFGKMLTKGFNMRQVGTYTIDAHFDKESVKELIEDAQRFVEEMKRIMKTRK